MATHRVFTEAGDPAYATAYGGSGGFGFDDLLTGGDRIHSLWIAAGNLIDSLQTVYRNGARGSRHGGLGGMGGWTALEPDELVMEVSGRYGGCVEQLAIRTTHRTIQAGNAGSRGEFFRIAAPEGAHVIGFHGRCGVYLDALGVRLAPLPAPRNNPAELARMALSRMPQVQFAPFRERRAQH